MDRVKLISVNVNGLRTRFDELVRYIQQQGENCIYALSDTRLLQGTNIGNINGYTLLRNDKIYTTPMATAGGVALLIPSKWTCQRVKINFKPDKGKEIEAIAAIILPSGETSQPIKVMSVYNHPENHFPQDLINEFKNMKFNGKETPGLIVGDFNCPHVAFGSRITNEYGTKLLQLVNNENLAFFNDGKSTYCSSSSGLSNVLDLVIGELSTSPFVESCTVSGDIGSDHYPVVTTLSFRAKVDMRNKVNKSLWAALINKEIENLKLSGCIDKDIENVSSIFQNTYAKSSSPCATMKKRLPPEILYYIRLRKMLLKNRQKATTDLSRVVITKRYNQINNKVKHLMKEFNEKTVENMANSICSAENSHKMWKIFNGFKKQYSDIDEPEAPLLTPNGDLTSDNKSRCDEFARYLRSVHQTPNSPFFDQQFKEQVVKSIEEQMFESETNSLPPIDVVELDSLLVETKSHSAPGEDLVTYEILKLCLSETRKVICCLFNQCLTQNIFPRAWKSAKVRMLAKPGRDKYQACNYRPISLLSCLGKMLERYIYKHLLQELNEKKFFNDNQAGFRKHRMTSEHLLRLAQQVSNGFKQRKCTLALFLDVKAAFDSVWKNGLKYKINRIGLTKQMRNMLFSFLDERTLRVNVDGTWSEIVTLEAGTPQGSCLSPILYLIYVNDVTDVLNLEKSSASQFADDIGLWTTESDVDGAKVLIQEAVDALEQWCRKWYVSLHPAKSKLILFTKCFRHKDEVEEKGLSITLFNEQVQAVKEADFLGVTFDTRLTYEPQIRKSVTKAYKRLNLLRMISAMSSQHKPDMLVTLYKSIIRPIFENSAICTVSAAETHIEKLQLLQNQALRVVLKTPHYVSIKDLHDLSGVSRIKDHLVSFAQRQLDNMRRHSPIINATVEDFRKVQHIKENASALDVLLRQ